MISGPIDIWSANLIDVRQFSYNNNDYKYLLNVIDTFSKYAWRVPLKTKTGSEVLKHLTV